MLASADEEECVRVRTLMYGPLKAEMFATVTGLGLYHA